MTTPTKEAAEIVAGKLGGGWQPNDVLAHSAGTIHAFARYVTEETEVTDAMKAVGRGFIAEATNWSLSYSQVEALFRAMIAAKHKGLLPAPAPAIDEEAVLREAREAYAAASLARDWKWSAEEARQGLRDGEVPMQALIAKTREVHELRAKLGEG